MCGIKVSVHVITSCCFLQGSWSTISICCLLQGFLPADIWRRKALLCFFSTLAPGLGLHFSKVFCLFWFVANFRSARDNVCNCQWIGIQIWVWMCYDWIYTADSSSPHYHIDVFPLHIFLGLQNAKLLKKKKKKEVSWSTTSWLIIFLSLGEKWSILDQMFYLMGKKKGEIGWIYLLDEDSSLESKMDVFDGWFCSDKCQLKSLHLRLLLDEKTFLTRKHFSFCQVFQFHFNGHLHLIICWCFIVLFPP